MAPVRIGKWFIIWKGGPMIQWSSHICPFLRYVGYLVPWKSAAKLAKTTEEHDHYMRLSDDARSRYQPFVQEAEQEVGYWIPYW